MSIENAPVAVEPSTAVPERTARVVLPDPEESDDEPQEAFIDEERDFLAELPDETEDLELVHLRIGSLAPLRLPRFAAHLKKLCLRQNFISRLDPEIFHTLTKLQELDLYDNKVKHLDDSLDNLSELSIHSAFLDLSFNLVKSVPEALQHLPSLQTVYFVQNRISRISNLQACVSLRSLELGGNKIRKIENLEALVNLEELWLGKNKITKLENLAYLSHNGVERIEGLERSLKLTTLDLGNNFIPEIENVAHLTNLEELWISGNKIPTLHALDSQLKNITTLRTLYLEGNPCQTTDMSGYRRKIILALPQLTQIDATYCLPTWPAPLKLT
ncbi:hypothetical protein C8F01DRAFT_1170675 [Mycena amicta]|nr:hypothetical protein C8F01DRAFT_1170675 [Mycena amicta]